MVWMGGNSSSSSGSPAPTTTSPSQSASPSRPRKRKITRTRTGCQTCRDRKVKCGEERPSCLNCQRTNHVCPGYAAATVFTPARGNRRTSDSNEEMDEAVSDTAVVTTSPSRSETNLSWTATPMESLEDLRLLHYYTFDLAHTLSLPGAIGRTWSDGVPRLAFGGDHVYLIHALLAVAAAHKVSKVPDDKDSQQRGQMHYVMCLSILKTLDLNAVETHASAALAAVMLLSWYESLYECWDYGVVHLQGAARIVREHNADLLKTPTGRQLFHLFARLELSASRHRLMDDQLTTSLAIANENYWEKAAFDFETLTVDDMYNGNSEFEYAWTEMMKIMVPVTVLRMVPRTGNRGTPERAAKGDEIQEMLRVWESSLPGSFMPIDPPDTSSLPETPILNHLEPIYYNSLNVAVAMAHHSALQINVFTLTHRGDDPNPDSRPEYLTNAIIKCLQICLGVQIMRQLNLFKVHEGGDYGIIWPLTIAGTRAPPGPIREWIQNLLDTWPREGLLDPVDAKICLEALWSRFDLGFGVEGLQNSNSARILLAAGQPVQFEIYERALSGEWAGWLRKVDITLEGGERKVVERQWHRGDMPLEHILNINKTPPMVLPP